MRDTAKIQHHHYQHERPPGRPGERKTGKMSTPSIASNTINNHHLSYGYSHHQSPYQSNAASYPSNNSVPTPRLTNSYYSYPSNQQSTSYRSAQRSPAHKSKSKNEPRIPPSHSTPNSMGRGQKAPDWEEYYKNGIPKEVIVIDDDTPPPPAPTARITTRRGAARGRRGNVQPAAGRKRKMDDSYDTGYHDSPAFSTHPAKFDEHSSPPSVRTERTTTPHTTAPTSLGSYGSSGASNSYEDVNSGQKRKRAMPKVTRAQTKRKEQEANVGAFADYVPPPKPPIKATDVHVPVIAAVSYCFQYFNMILTCFSMATNIRRSMTRTDTSLCMRALI